MSAEKSPYQKTETLRSPEKENHNRIVLYTGISCSGKDFLLDGAVAKFDTFPLQRISVGTFIANQLAVHRDQLRGQPGLQEIEEFKMTIVPDIVAKQPAILVSHIVPKYKRVITLNPDFETALNPSHFVVVVSEPKNISAWREERNKGGTRFAPIEDPTVLNLHQQLVLHNTFLIAQAIGAGFSVINNNPSEEQTAGNIDFLKEVLEQI